MATRDGIRTGMVVKDAQGQPLGNVQDIREGKAFMPYQGETYAIPLDNFQVGSNELTLNHAGERLPSTWKAQS